MSPTTGSHLIYRVYGEPKCAAIYYDVNNIDDAVYLVAGEDTDTEPKIASKANDYVGDAVFTGCICGDYSWSQTNFNAAMGEYPTNPPKGMCCCRAEGLDCILNVLGIGPYTHDYVNELNEPNPTASRPANQYCATCGKTCCRWYWDSFWNNWEGVVKAGGTGSTCYAPANGSISIDEGTYSQIDSAIASDCGYYWVYSPYGQNNTCSHLPPP